MSTKKSNRKKKGKLTHKNRGYVTLAAVALCGIAVAGVFFLFGLLGGQEGDTGQPSSSGNLSVELYFVDSVTKEWEVETRNIFNGDKKQVVEEVRKLLREGPKSSGLAKTIPEDIEINIKLVENEKIAEIQFSDNYKELSPMNAMICLGSIVCTFTGLDFIDNVHAYIGEEELLAGNGKAVGLLNRDNIVLYSNVEPDNPQTQAVIKLYFSDSQGMSLVPEERTVVYNPNQSLEYYVINGLIQGPKNQELSAVIPQEAKLRSIKTEDGICYVDFSSDIMNKLSGSTTENLFIYSIVDSLTELTGVKKVQFLFDGAKISEDSGFSTDLSNPIERDESLLTEM